MNPKTLPLYCGLLCAGALQTAVAQNAVTIFGTLDLNVTVTRAGGQRETSMDQGGNLLPSRLGFRGVEDLGGGLDAGFWLESAVLPDTGQHEGGMWHRRSTVSLRSAQWGELRLGRDYMPTFWNMSQFAPFGTVGVAGSSNIVENYPFGVGGARTLVRANNSVGWFSPRGLGGWYGQTAVSASEGVDGARYIGGRVGYATGALDVAFAYGETRLPGDDFKVTTLGGSYDFGVVKLMGYWLDQRAGADRQANMLLGATVPLGIGTLRASIARSDRKGPGVGGDDASQVAIGYVHPLSKRTALYGTYSHIRNRGNAAYFTADSSPAPTPGGNASGVQAGISHNF